MNRDMTNLNVGDYIGDENDVSWRVDKVTEEQYDITAVHENISKTILRAKDTDKYFSRNAGKYVEHYHLLRPANHKDIVNFPIGSTWKCMDKSGLNDPKKDVVNIVYYAYSEGMFWVCNSEHPSMLFLARDYDLRHVRKRKK